MGRALLANNASTTLSAAISSTGATTFSVTSAASFPSVTTASGNYFYCTLVDAVNVPEIVRVTDITGTTMTCTRAQDGTAARTFLNGATVSLRLVSAVMAELQTALVSGANLRTVNGETLLGGSNLVITSAEVVPPINTFPADAATGVSSHTLSADAFYSNYGATHAASQWQLHTSNDFSSPQYSSGDQAAGTSWVVPTGQVVATTLYWWRARYKNSRGVYSAWSTPTSFSTGSVVGDFIATPVATPAAFGDALEGGFYAGMIWNELVQSATSALIGTGSKTFTVADMSITPTVYLGQSLEVRSRSNPVNKMVGTVTGATGITLTLDITSMGGSGTTTDWSIMSRYRVIVSPKSAGEANKAYKNAVTAAPSACITLTEGRKATLAMVAADTATVYPAAHFCNSLSIGGKADWYLASRDELELLWRNLKPTADNNYVTANRISYPTALLGSYADTSAAHGTNVNSSPVGAAYTTGVPAQVATGKNFRGGESEALAYGAGVYYRASSEDGTNNGWVVGSLSANAGWQGSDTKTTVYPVRAVRRSII